MENNNSILSNLFWKFAERITAQIVTVIVSIILARLLEPSHYGVIAIVNIFIAIANVFVTDGLASALIQKKNADKIDYSSVLYFNLFLSVALYIGLFFLAPVITSFYGDGYDILTPVLRILGFRLMLSAINSVQQAYVAKHMIFRKFFLATLSGTVISAVVGIIMAYNGFGVWALVAQYLTNTTVDTVVLGLSLKKKNLCYFSWKRIKVFLGFGIKILGANLLITGYQELRSLMIGKIYTSSDLAFYDQGKRFPNLIVTNINVSIDAVLFPKMASEQDNLQKIKLMTRKSIKFSAFLMCPLMLGLAVVANSFVTLILTEKWIPCVPLLQLFCIIYLFQPIHTANMQAIKAIGRGDIYAKLEIIKKSIEFIVLIFTVNISIEAIVIGMAVLTTLFTFVNAYPNIKLINYSFVEQMGDICPAIGRAMVMVFVVIGISKVNIPMVLMLMIQVIGGMLTYLMVCCITKCPELCYIFDLTKRYFIDLWRKNNSDN